MNFVLRILVIFCLDGQVALFPVASSANQQLGVTPFGTPKFPLVGKAGTEVGIVEQLLYLLCI